MRKRMVLVTLLLCILTACAQAPAEKKDPVFTSPTYHFSFSYPADWQVVDRDLPDRWAILKDSDTMLFLISDAPTTDLITLGTMQAIRDYFPGGNGTVTKDELAEALQVITLATFGKTSYYTYAMDFPSKNLNSVISGTVCQGKEITLVLVSDKDKFDQNKALYSQLLASFSCDA